MNKLLTKIVGLSLGLSMAIGVGVAVGVKGNDAVLADAAQNDELLVFNSADVVTGSSYTTTYNDSNWTLTIGGNNVSAGYNKNNVKQIPSTYQDGTVVTSSHYGWVAATKSTVTNVGKLTFTYTGGSGNSTGCLALFSSADGSTYSIVTLTSGTQGTSVGTANQTTTFEFATKTSATYYAIVCFTSSSSGAFRFDSVTAKLLEGATGSSSISVDSSSSVKVGSTSTLGVTYTGLASGITISATSDDTSVATVTSSVTTTGASGTANFTLTGVAEGSANVSFSATYQGTPLSCSSAVTVYAEYNFQKITKVPELNTSEVSGGRYVIASSTDSTIVMSTTQNSNNRGKTSADIVGDVMTVSSSSSIAILNILKVGDYYTIYDAANSGYLYAVSGQNHLKTSNPATKTDYYYWSISFSSGNVVITNKGNSYVIRYNSGSSIFSTYNGTQNAIELWELDSDIPVYVQINTISASNSSVQVGSIITFTGTYLPANATEGIVITTLDSTYATAGDVSMSAGNFTVSIEGVAATTGTSLVFEGEDGHGSASVTLTVVAYAATHDLVTSASSLSNGARVVIGCTDADFNYIAEHSTGSSNLNAVTTGFAADKSTLAATSSQEFTIWCVDTTNGYYVLSDGGYYLTSPTSKNNYLQRTDTLAEACYFTIDDSASGISVKNSYGVNHEWKDVTDPYTIAFNESTSKFSLYNGSGKSTSLYISKQSVNPVQGFIDVFMHFGNVSKTDESDTNACRSEGSGAKHYWTDASTAYETLTPSQQLDFVQNYVDAAQRLSDWADANGAELDLATGALSAKVAPSIFGTVISDSTATTIVVVISVLSVSAIGGFFFLRKRKEQ